MKRNVMKIVILFLVGSFIQAAWSQDGADWDINEITAFLDSRLSEYEAEGAFAGAAVSLVNDGEIVFAKGYGKADLEHDIPVNEETTQFRIGSITKIFTSTAVLQLVEQGVLDLDRDIHDYIDFTIPGIGETPITLHHLLTHTAGFEDRSYGLWAEDISDKTTLGEWLKSHIPAVTHPAGAVIMYSNFGMTLAGYIVERRTGLSYEDYIIKNIFQPLGMTNSNARQEIMISPNFLSKGYLSQGRMFEPQNPEIIQIAPAGSLSSSARDMAHFMIAHLSENDSPLFSEETGEMMHRTRFSHGKGMNGMAYGFEERDRRGLDILHHEGDTLFFHSKIAQFKDKNTGLFLTVNTTSDIPVLKKIYSDFLDEFAPYDTEIWTEPFFRGHGEECAGWYRSNRRSETTGEKLDTLLKPFIITSTDEYAIQVMGETFREMEPYTFKMKDDDVYLYFDRDEEGNIYRVIINTSPAGVLERTPLRDHPLIHLVIAAFIILAALSAAVNLPVRGGWRALRKNTSPSRMVRSNRWTRWAVSIGEIGFFLLLVSALSDPNQILYGDVKSMPFWLVLYLLVVLLFLAETGLNLWSLRRKDGLTIGRVFTLGQNIGAGLFIWFVQYWHLLKL